MLTIFTPTYNRAYILPKLYESLREQSCHDLEWIIVDDGSTDDTRSLVEGWTRAVNPFPSATTVSPTAASTERSTEGPSWRGATSSSLSTAMTGCRRMRWRQS